MQSQLFRRSDLTRELWGYLPEVVALSLLAIHLLALRWLSRRTVRALGRVALLAQLMEGDEHRCVQCGYERSGLPRLAPCPECAHNPVRPPRRPWSVWSLAPLLFGAAASLQLAFLVGRLSRHNLAVTVALGGIASLPFAAISLCIATSAVSRWPQRIASISVMPCIFVLALYGSCGGLPLIEASPAGLSGTDAILYTGVLSALGMFLGPAMMWAIAVSSTTPDVWLTEAEARQQDTPPTDRGS